MIALVGASVWRFGQRRDQRPSCRGHAGGAPSHAPTPQPRIVRADTYLAVAALEDHIASVDDALNDARTARVARREVARLERARAELLDSYARVRYAEMVSANF